MTHELKGKLQGDGLKVAIVVSQFNEFLTTKLLQGAYQALQKCGVRSEHMTVVWVPGSLELTQAARRLIMVSHWDALVTLGVVIRGETSHFDYVAGETAKGITSLSKETGVPIAFGVLTTNDVEQATARAGGKLGNRGYDAAITAVTMANLFREIEFAFTPQQEAKE